MRISRRIRTLRRTAGLTQSALAKKAGVSRPYLSRLEGTGTRRHDPPVSTVQRIAKALGVRVTEVLR